MLFSKQKPTSPGWYWCRNEGDTAGQVWEAIVLIQQCGTIDSNGARPDGLIGSWMSAPGECDIMHERDWSDGCEWAGPIQPPGNSTSFRGKPVE